MSALNNSLLLGQEGGGGYAISRSLRFNSSDSAYLSRTPASAGNRKTWTWAGWVKRSNTDSDGAIIFSSSPSAGANTYICFAGSNSTGTTADGISFFSAPLGVNVGTAGVFRDFSAWFHLVVTVDTTQGTAANRVKIYVNGTEVTYGSTSYPTSSQDLGINAAFSHAIGTTNNLDGWAYFNGYLADIHFIDGQALTPTSFGEFSATTGVWMPKAYTGTYGTNGFHLDFSNNASAAALGTDISGNGNDWTVNNISNNTDTGYLDDFSISGTLYPGSSLANAFDGNTATSATVTNAAQNQTLTFAPSPGIAYTSGVEVYLTPTGNVAVTRYSFNGGSDQSFSAGDGWKTVASGSGTMTSLVIKQGAQSNSVGISAIRINGTTILVDDGGKGTDSLVDVPTNGSEVDTGVGGEVRGNYCTLNPLSSQGGTLSNGNLNYTGTSLNFATIAVTTGKWYWEVTNTGTLDDVNNTFMVGVASDTRSTDTFANKVQFYSQASQSAIYRNSGSAVETLSGTTLANGDVLGIALDLDSGTQAVQFYKNGSTIGSSTSLNNANQTWTPSVKNAAASIAINFGQRPFAYPVAGYKSLNTASLPAPLVTKSSTVFDVKLYTGNGSTQTISGLGFSPDLVWTKTRSQANNNFLFDSVRGVGNWLISDLTNAETYSANTLTSFNSDGFTTGANNDTNGSGRTFVAWAWDAGSSTVTNTQGSITGGAQVRANATAGFSIVTWSVGTAVNNSTIGHGLGAAPSFIICKTRNASNQNWIVYHKSLGTGDYLALESTQGSDTRFSTIWGTSAPTSTVFGVGLSGYSNNTSSNNYVAYCFAPVAGYSSAFSFTGTGTDPGPFVYLGFRPKLIIIKRTDNGNAASNWRMLDMTINPYNVADTLLFANLSLAELTEIWGEYDALSNGFRVMTPDSNQNAAGGTYIGFAWAESPFNYARAR
jgi:hypothetical protein